MNHPRFHGALATKRCRAFGFALALCIGFPGVVTHSAHAQVTQSQTAAVQAVRTPAAAVQSVHMQAAALRTTTDDALLTLRMLLDSVSRDYPAIRAAASRVTAADGARVTSHAFGNPVLSYQTDQTPFPGGQPLVGLDRETMITATIPLEWLYQRSPRVARGNAELRAAQADAMTTRQRVGLDAANAFYRVAIAQIQVETLRELGGWLDSVVAYNRARVREGAAAEADLIRATIERDRVLLDGTMQSAELMQARAMLGVFVQSLNATTFNARTNPATLNGRTQTAIVAIDDAPFSLPVMQSTSSTLTTLGAGKQTSDAPPLIGGLINTRPEVRAARERVTAANSQITTEHSMVLRQLSATIGTMQSGKTTSMIAGVSLPMPLLDRNRGEIQRARAERDVAKFELATQERMAIGDLQGAYDAAVLLTERATSLTKRDTSNFLSRAEESRRIALGAYREGAVPLLQVIDAARSWADSRVTYFRIVFAQQQSILTLLVAEGVDLFSTQTQVAVSGSSKQ